MAMLVMAVTMVSFNTFADDGELVPQPLFEHKLSCKSETKRSICFNRAIKYSHPDAYLFEFTVNFDLDESKVTKAIELSLKQTSMMLNPLAARFYQYESPIIELINQTKYSATDIIVSFKTVSRGDVYSSYFLPLIEEGDIVLFSGTFRGATDIYNLLKSQCNRHSKLAPPYRHNGSTCVLQNSSP
jgi:hypothetical protein